MILCKKESVFLGDEYPDLVDSIAASVGFDPHTVVHAYKTSRVAILGHEYRPGCCLVIDYLDDVPQFGIVEAILIINDEKVFIVECMGIEYFDSHIMSYVLESKYEHFQSGIIRWGLSKSS